MPLPLAVITACSEFALETHSGDYATWPLRTRLLRRGVATSCLLPGYSLLHQYAITVDGQAFEYLLVIDCDCPFEEATTVILLSADAKKLGSCSFAAPYASWLLAVCAPSVAADGCPGVNLSFGAQDNWRVSVQAQRGSRLLRSFWPRLRRKRIPGSPDAMATIATIAT